MSEKTTGSRKARRLVQSASANPPPRASSTAPLNNGRREMISSNPAARSTGNRSSKTAGRTVIRALATRRGMSHAARVAAAPLANENASYVIHTHRPDSKAIAPQNRVSDQGRCQIAELQTTHEWPGKRDPASTAIEAALDDAGGDFGADQ